jgi:transcriptional regulator with XRE-family HTH domain
MPIEKKPARIKFGEILGGLLERERHRVSRKEICKRLGISQAVLSQYVHGKSTPRLNTLASLAQFFAVDLDHLVFGEPSVHPRPVDLGPFEYIDKSLAGLHAKNDAYFSAVARITSSLAQEVENAARKVVDEYDISGGVIHDNDVLIIERYSEETCLVRLRLDFQFDAKSGRPVTTMPGGRFLPLVAKNLSEGRKYVYVLPREVRDWRAPVKEFRKVLASFGVDPAQIRDNCRIGVTGSPLVAGCVIYRLNRERMQSEHPHLSAQLELSITRDRKDTWLGCTLPPSTRLQANPVMDSYHLAQARKMIRVILERDFQEL